MYIMLNNRSACQGQNAAAPHPLHFSVGRGQIGTIKKEAHPRSLLGWVSRKSLPGLQLDMGCFWIWSAAGHGIWPATQRLGKALDRCPVQLSGLAFIASGGFVEYRAVIPDHQHAFLPLVLIHILVLGLMS